MFRLIVQRPVAVAMISLAAALFGLLSLQQRPMSLMPPLTFPTLTILTQYPGAAPEEVETELTEPIEERLGTIEGLRALRSKSKAGLSELKLELAWGADLNYSLQRVYERLDRIQLPEGVDPPQVLRYDPTLEPLMVVALTQAGQAELIELRRYAEESLTPALYQVEGVAAVKVTGGAREQVEVALHPDALRRYQLTPKRVADQLRAAHVNLAGGQLRTEHGEVLIRTLAQIESVEALGELIIHQTGGAWVRLKDIATLSMRGEERRSWVQVGLDEAVRVQIYRQADANLVDVARALRAALFERVQGGGEVDQAAALRLALPHPEGVEAHLVQDQARFIESALSAVGGAIWVGGLLAIIILYLFLRSAYQTLVVALSIPLSVILSFIPLHAFDVSLNLMSLGGLALGVGMLVDNAVVVLESIAKERERGAQAFDAAVAGASEVGSAVLASTLTTVAVFLPVAFIEGIAGQVFRDLALTVVSALLASLAVALGVVPTLAARDPGALKGAQAGVRGEVSRGLLPMRQLSALWASRARLGTLKWALTLPLTLPLALLELTLYLIGNLSLLTTLLCLGLLRLPWLTLKAVVGLPMRGLSYLVGRNVSWLERQYSAALERSLKRPLALIVVACLGGALAWNLSDEIPRSLLPEVAQGVLIAELDYPVGSALMDTQARAQRWIERLTRGDLKGVRRVELLIGQDEADEQGGSDRGPHQARLTISLERRGLEEALSAQLRRWAETEPGAQLKVKRPSLLTLNPPLRVALRGRHLASLKAAEDRVFRALSSLEGLSDLERSMGQGYPEIKVEYDGARLSYLGLSPLEVAEQLRGQLSGVEALELRWDSVMVPIIVRSEGARVLREDQLPSLMISGGGAGPLPLASVAQLTPSQGPAEIRHLDGQRAAEVSAYTSAFELGRRADELMSALERTPLPRGVELSLAGQETEMSESARQLTMTLLLSLFLVFVVMATQFESLRAPLLIMGAVPLAGIGVSVGLWWTQTPLSVVVFVGMITLSGVVVNNAIVYIDAAQRAMGRGLDATQALVEAGRARLRPILMTTLTTLIGLLPMLSPEGEGAELRAPLALTLIFGLGVSTVLILFILPALSQAFAPPRAAPSVELEVSL